MRNILLLITLCGLHDMSAASATCPTLEGEVVLASGIVSNDSARVLELNQQCFVLSDQDPDKAITYGRSALDLARRIGFKKGQAQAHSHIGYCLTRKSDFDQARAEYDRGIALFRELKDPCGEADVLYNVGLNHQMRQQDAEALEVFLRVLHAEEPCPGKRSVRLYAIGTAYANMYRYKEALPFYLEALTIDSAAGDPSRIAREYVAIANCYSGAGDHERALGYHRRAIASSLALGDSLTVAYVHYNLSEIEAVRGDHAAAVDHAEQAFELLERMDRKAELAHAAMNLGDQYTRAGRAKDAERVLLQGLALARMLGLASDSTYTLLALAHALESQGDARTALSWYKRHMLALDSLNIQERDERLTELTTRFETEKKEKELLASREQELLSQQEADQQRAQKVAWTIGAALLAVAVLALWNNVRTKRRHVRELEQRNAEVIRQKERAEESERAKDRFLANMSHELRTPLNAITGFTDLLLHDAHDERHRRFLTSIRNAGDNLLVMINDVLDLGRIEAGRYTLRNEPFDLHRCVRLCADMLHSRAIDQCDAFIVTIQEDVPRGVRGDSARLTQIILNLVGNALKFTQSGQVNMDVARCANGVRISVSDTGIGIPADKVAGIFDRFSQVHESDQREYGGTGLGLAIVKELVALHEGSIEVRSEVGKGAEFVVTLPYKTAPLDPAAAPEAMSKVPSGSLIGRTVLIAEDNEANALVTQETLARFHPGARTIVVRNGRAAVERVREDGGRDIALVLMDVQMPELDGIAATREVRALQGAAARVPIIALTASVLPSDLSRCIDAGMDACLSKPFRTENLLVTIERLIGDPGVALPNEPLPQGASPYDRLFKQQVPRDLQALRSAFEKADFIEVARVVHLMRPQLVHRDKSRYAGLCDRVAGSAKALDTTDLYEAVRCLVDAVEHELVAS